MSTRSGKRIHTSFHESSVPMDMESAVKSERKTRSRRLKENVEELGVSLFKKKKRNNYVSYPTDDEQNGMEAGNNNNEGAPARVLRRNTLKEQNIDVTNIETTEPKTLTRKSRRGKKNTDNTPEDPPEAENVEIVQSVKPKSKKSKKKKDIAPIDLEEPSVTVSAQPDETPVVVSQLKSKKKKRKGRKSNSLIVEDLKDKNNTFNNSKISNDSFHSAAGSPRNVLDEVVPVSKDNIIDYVEMRVTTPRKCKSFRDHVDGQVDLTRMIMDIDVVNPKKSFKGTMKRKSIQNDTSDKSDPSILGFSKVIEKDTDTDSITLENLEAKPIRISNINNCSFDQSKVIETTFEKHTNMDILEISEIKSSLCNGTFDISKKLDTTFEKETMNKNSTYDKILDTTSEKDTNIVVTPNKKKSSIHNGTFDKNDIICADEGISTPPGSNKKRSVRKSSVKKSTFDKSNISKDDEKVIGSAKKLMTRKSVIDTTFEKSNSSVISLDDDKEILNSVKKRKSVTHDSSYGNVESLEKNSTFDKETNLSNKWTSERQSKLSITQDTFNATYEKVTENSKSSLISSDNSENDKSNISRISITSDDSSDNIMKTTPVLIESSMDESHILKDESLAPQTTLKREGTFTKEGPEVPEADTPSKWKTLPVIPAAGCTPFHITRSSQKSVFNITRSIEKGRPSLEQAPRTTRVMFCSPIDNPSAVAQEKRKVIKSNLKGSNKSFVFEDSVAELRPAARKRSFTQNDADDTRIKRKRLADDLQQSVNRLSRPRTSSATGKLSKPTTPSKKTTTPSKSKSDNKPSRTKLPNFAALHQQQFAKMESLNECQERRAKRAKQLLTPTGAADMLERISPKAITMEPPKPKDQAKKMDTPTKSESVRPGFTRFGFKLNLDVNPFSVPSKNPDAKPNPTLPLPSLTGATSARREVAKMAVMREKSFTDKRNLVKRNENRTIIRGVRTNRRFELQMKMRNVD